MSKAIRTTVVLGALAAALATWGPGALAQTAGGGTAARSPQELEQLVGRVALYPDDLLAIVLPASTMPLDVVQADRFLQARQKDNSLQPSEKWDASVRALLNYPDVVTMMSQDLDWTSQLGEAVVAQQADVMAAIQSFRAKASAAGNLKTDDKLIVAQEQQIITIIQQDPQVIYVPQYNPATVIVQQPPATVVVQPPVAYYPTPYPTYYYPYPPGAAFATGFFFGAATAYAFNWGSNDIDYDVDIDRTTNINRDRPNNPQAQQRAEQARQQGQQRRAEGARPTTQQAGRAQAQQGRGTGAGGAASKKWSPPAGASQLGAGRAGGAGAGLPGQTRPAAQPSGGMGRPGAPSAAPRADGGFGNYGRGQDAANFSNRGQQSRAGMSAPRSAPSPSAGARGGGGFSGGGGGRGGGGFGGGGRGGGRR